MCLNCSWKGSSSIVAHMQQTVRPSLSRAWLAGRPAAQVAVLACIRDAHIVPNTVERGGNSGRGEHGPARFQSVSLETAWTEEEDATICCRMQRRDGCLQQRLCTNPEYCFALYFLDNASCYDRVRRSENSHTSCFWDEIILSLRWNESASYWFSQSSRNTVNSLWYLHWSSFPKLHHRRSLSCTDTVSTVSCRHTVTLNECKIKL